jgi:hypothetical protein
MGAGVTGVTGADGVEGAIGVDVRITGVDPPQAETDKRRHERPIFDHIDHREYH